MPPGSRPTVVLLHSLGLSSSSWDLVRPLLEAQIETVAPDSLGHGGRVVAAGGEEPTLAGWVEDLVATLTELDRGPVHVVGVSLGGVQAMALAALHPHLVCSLVIADSFAALPVEAAQARISATGAGVRDLGMTGFAEQYLDETLIQPMPRATRQALSAAIAGIAPATYLASARACFTADVRPRLGEIRCPTLVLVGALDHKTPMHLAEEIHTGIRGSGLLELPGAGHLPHLDQPALLAEVLLNFVAQHQEEA